MRAGKSSWYCRRVENGLDAPPAEGSAARAQAAATALSVRRREYRLSVGAGQGLIEYGLILAIMAVACVVSLLFFGHQLSSLLSLVAAAV